METQSNRTKVINALNTKTKCRNVLYASVTNSLTHEMVKFIVFYYLRKGYSIEFIESALSDNLNYTDISSFEEKMKISLGKPSEVCKLILTESEIGCDKIDIVDADNRQLIEIDYKHKTSSEKIKRLKSKGFRINIINI